MAPAQPSTFTLTASERRVLCAVQLRAHAQPAALARELGMREHTVRRAVQRLKASGAIQRYPFINIFPLGLEEAAVFFSLSCRKQVHERLLGKLTTHQNVAWVIDFAGNYQYGAAICVRRAHEVVAVLDDVSARLDDVFVERSITFRTAWYLFPRKYLAALEHGPRYLACGDTGELVELDPLDRRILELLATYEYSSFRELARALGISHTAFRDRLERLRSRKVIAGFAYGVDASVFGMQVYRLLVYARRRGKQLRDEMFAFAETHPAVVAMIECVGSWDFELKAEVSSSEELSSLLHVLYERFGSSVQDVKVLSVLRTRKLEFYPFKAELKAVRGLERVRHYD